jgi:hypothetical protein
MKNLFVKKKDFETVYSNFILAIKDAYGMIGVLKISKRVIYSCV